MATWTIHVHPSILGPIVAKVRRGHDSLTTPDTLPPHVQEYLNLDPKQLRPVMRDFKDLSELDAVGLDDMLIKRTRRLGGRVLTIRLADPPRPPKPQKIPKRTPAIRSFRDLLTFFGADVPDSLNHRIYKDTDCGASISIRLRDDDWIHNGSDRWKHLTGDEVLEAFTIQTIVEGLDATVDSDAFRIPCTQLEVLQWMKWMEEEADRLWSDANEDDESADAESDEPVV